MGNTFFFGWEPALMAWLQANLGVFGVKLAVFLTLFGQETIMVLLLGYVQLTTVSNNVSTIKKELATLEEEHVSLLTEYEKVFDLATIKAAAEAAGMSKPTSGQIQYIDLGGSDTAVVYSGEPGLMDKAAAAVKEGALSLWEYFR